MGGVSDRNTGIVKINDREFGYLVDGKGVPCLAIGSTVFWPPTFSQSLRQHVRLIFADTRFIGSPSEPDSHDRVTLDSLIDEVEHIRRACEIDRLGVLGHSALGLLALEYARRYPQHVSGVVMIGTPPYTLLEFEGPAVDFVPEVKRFWDEDASAERKAILESNQAELSDLLSEVPPGKAFGVWYVAHGPMVWHNPNYDASWLFDPIEFDSPVFNHFLDVLLRDYDVTESLREVVVPVFLALGRHDYLVPYILWDEPCRSVTNLSCHVFENSGHYPMFEESELFDKRLLEWMKTT